MEMSHRSPEFMGVIDKAEADLRSLLNIPANYKILFLQGDLFDSIIFLHKII